MPINPLDFFEVGQTVGKSKKNAFSSLAEGVLGNFQAEKERKIKQSTELDTYRKKKEIDVEATRDLYPGLTGGENEDMMLSGVSATGKPFYRSKTYMKEQAGMRAEADLAKKRMSGAGAQSTPINAASQSLKSASNAKRILFPDGTPNSFRRELAATKGRFLKQATLSRDAQNLAREYGIALDLYNRQVTGAAFNKDEWNQRISQFQSDLLSNPQAAFDSLSRLEELNSDYLKIADPSGIYSGGNQQGGAGHSNERQEALDAIRRGAPEDKVRQRFQQEFGEDL